MGKSFAAHYYQLSADRGNTEAHLYYGVLLYHGSGLSMNKSLAAHYYQLSTDQGNAEAEFYYGPLLSRGEGIVMNKSPAVHYYQLQLIKAMHKLSSITTTCFMKLMISATEQLDASSCFHMREQIRIRLIRIFPGYLSLPEGVTILANDTIMTFCSNWKKGFKVRMNMDWVT
jgi:hypothetical protein